MSNEMKTTEVLYKELLDNLDIIGSHVTSRAFEKVSYGALLVITITSAQLKSRIDVAMKNLQ